MRSRTTLISHLPPYIIPEGPGACDASGSFPGILLADKEAWCTMRLGSTPKVLAKLVLHYYRISKYSGPRLHVLLALKQLTWFT